MHKFSRTITIWAMARKVAAKLALIAPIAALLLLAVTAAPGHADDTFIAVLNSGQEASPNMSKALGNAHMVFDKQMNMLCYSISFVGPVVPGFGPLPSGPCPSGGPAGGPSDLENCEIDVAAHFHGPASAGVNAAVLFHISPLGAGPSPGAPSPVGSPKTGCVGPLDKQERKALRDGLFYINIHSNAVPSGEIRGQVLRIKGVK